MKSRSWNIKFEIYHDLAFIPDTITSGVSGQTQNNFKVIREFVDNIHRRVVRLIIPFRGD